MQIAQQNKESLLNNIYNYLFNNNVNQDPLMELIMEYCQKYDYEYSEIGELISEDDKLKKAIEMDCIKHHYFRGNNNILEEW